MAAAANNSIVTVGSATTSDWVTLSNGYEYVLQCSSSGAYTLDIQVSADSSNWSDAYYDATTKVTLDSTGVQTVRVVGGLYYRMDVTTYNSTITMKVSRV